MRKRINKGSRGYLAATIACYGPTDQRACKVSGHDHRVAEAITAHGYSEIEVASFLGLHYSTISRILTTDKRANIKT